MARSRTNSSMSITDTRINLYVRGQVAKAFARGRYRPTSVLNGVVILEHMPNGYQPALKTNNSAVLQLPRNGEPLLDLTEANVEMSEDRRTVTIRPKSTALIPAPKRPEIAVPSIGEVVAALQTINQAAKAGKIDLSVENNQLEVKFA